MQGWKRCVAAVTPVIGAALAPSAAHADWLNFRNETTTRLVAAPLVGASDGEEKDFAWADLDKDGDPDLVIARKQPWTTPGGRRNVLLMNEGTAQGWPTNGVLVDRTAELAPQMLDLTNDRDVIIADVTGDGWPDVITAVAMGGNQPKAFTHPRIYVNKGKDGSGNWLGLVYDDPERVPTFPCEPRFNAVAAGDIDGDGDLDLYFADGDFGIPQPPCDLNDRLLANNGSGYFTDISEEAMTPQMLASCLGTAAAIVDMNSDGAPDVVKCSAGCAPIAISISYNTPGTPGVFTKQQFVYSGSPLSLAVGDLNGDFNRDIVVPDDGVDRYLLNQGSDPNGLSKFTTLAFQFVSGDDGFAGNARIADLDNDGWNDALICDVEIDIPGCSRRMHAFRNLGNVPNVTLQEQLFGGVASASLQGTHDVATLDINMDGWLDLVIGRCSGTSIWISIPPAALKFTYPAGLPSFVSPNQPHVLPVQVEGVGTGEPKPDSGVIHISVAGGPFTPAAMKHLGNNLYDATLPAVDCGSNVRFFVSAETTTGGTLYDPPNAGLSSYKAVAAGAVKIVAEEFEGTPTGWTVTNDPSLTAGAWEHGVPDCSASPAGPCEDNTIGSGVKCFQTQIGVPGSPPTAFDVDGGPTTLTSPVFDLAGTDGRFDYAVWFHCDDLGTSSADVLSIEVSNDDGATWSPVESVATSDQLWQSRGFWLSDFVVPSGAVRVRFSTQDVPNNSITEAGLDSFIVTKALCGPACMGDIDGDGKTCQGDLGILLAAYGTCEGDPGYNASANLSQAQPVSCSAGKQGIDQSDLGVLLSDYGCGGCP